EKYRHVGWEIFEAFVKHTAVEDGGGFSSIADVTHIPPPTRDNMESFWPVRLHDFLMTRLDISLIEQAEKLKYFYLLFWERSVLPLDQVVFNTEAHPFPRIELGNLFWTGWKRKGRDPSGFPLQDAVGEEQDTKVRPSSSSA